MKLRYLLGMVLASLLANAAQAIVIDFEHATPYSINWLPGDYDGVHWGDYNFGVISDAGVPGSTYGYQTEWHNTYGSPSGIYAAYNAGGVTRSITFDAPIDFIGAYFTSWAAYDDFKEDGSKFIWIGGYKNNTYVTGVGAYLSANRYDWVQADFKNIDRIDIFTMWNPQWWLMDDFTYQKASVPAPNGMPLLLLGMALIALTRKIRRK